MLFVLQSFSLDIIFSQKRLFKLLKLQFNPTSYDICLNNLGVTLNNKLFDTNIPSNLELRDKAPPLRHENICRPQIPREHKSPILMSILYHTSTRGTTSTIPHRSITIGLHLTHRRRIPTNHEIHTKEHSKQ